MFRLNGVPSILAALGALVVQDGEIIVISTIVGQALRAELLKIRVGT